MALVKEDLQAISQLLQTTNETVVKQVRVQVRAEIRESSNLILSELGRVEQRINNRFEKVNLDMKQIREDVHVTKYSNDTVELLLRKVTELENRLKKVEQYTA